MYPFVGMFFVAFLLQQSLMFSYALNEDSDELALELINVISDLNNKKQGQFEKPLVEFTGRLMSSKNFPKKIGHISGLAMDSNGSLVVFHRSTRKWSFNSFVENNKFNVGEYGVIPNDCVVHVNPSSQAIVKSWGSNTFYMPHGIHIDSTQNIWLTDVGLHQVFKFSSDNLAKPSLVLGVAFENGQDQTHFCKPTDVAVRDTDGDVFVADGYCNSRIVQFDKDGRFKKVFEFKAEPIRVAHSLALIDDQNLICVADRENKRIICFDIDTASVRHILENEDLGRVFAIEYDRNFKLLHAISGTGFSEKTVPLGYTFDVAEGNGFGQLLETWEPEDAGFSDPHDLTITSDGLTIYTGDLNGDIEQFQIQ